MSKCLGKPTFTTSEVDEVDVVSGLGIGPPVVVDRRIALQRKTIADRVALSWVVDQQRESSRVDGQSSLVGCHIVGHAVLWLACRIAADHSRAIKFQGAEHTAIEVIRVSTGGLSDKRTRVHHGDLRDLLATFLFAADHFAMHAHLGILTGVRTGRSLAACIGIDLRVQHEDLDIHAGGQHPRQCLESNVEHGAVATEAPDRLVVPSHLIPTHAQAHREGGHILEQRIAPRHQVRIVGIRRCIDRVTTGGGHDPPVVPVLGSRRRAHHPQCRALAATSTAAGAANVNMRLFLEHHVNQQIIVDVPLVRRPKLLEQSMALTDFQHQVICLFDHLQCIVVANRHAFGTSLALAGIDDDGELASFAEFLLRPVIVLSRLGPLLAGTSPVRHRRRSAPFDPSTGSRP